MRWVFNQDFENNRLETLKKSRGISLNEGPPNLENLNNPFSIFEIEISAKKILRWVQDKKKIFIHGDFDVDGISATAILWNYLYKVLKADVVPFIPNRFTDGYGLSEESIRQILAQNGECVITVDCGGKDIERVAKYKDKLEFVITDHHTLLSDEPTNCSKSDFRQVGEYFVTNLAPIVHPRLNPKEFSDISGSFVAFKLVSVINEIGKFKVDMRDYADLAALGTVCDVLPLIGENREIVRIGLEVLNTKPRIGIKALLEIAEVKTKIDTYHLGFVIGPRLNAAGRLESALTSLKLLTTESIQFAFQIATELDELNKVRQNLTKKYLEIAENEILSNQNQSAYVIVGENWPEGIVGLIAGKLAEKYSKPVIIGSDLGEIIKASGRSVSDFHISNTLNSLTQYLNSHGGHQLAAGMTIKKNLFNEFRNEFQSMVSSQVGDNGLEKTLVVDLTVDVSEINLAMFQEIQSLSPFGFGNKKPIFVVKNLRFITTRRFGVGSVHFGGITASNLGTMEVIKFNIDSELEEKISKFKKNVDIAGFVCRNEYNGKTSIRFELIDLRETE